MSINVFLTRFPSWLIDIFPIQSSVSRSVVKPFKFLHSPNSSGVYNTNGNSGSSTSPHSSGSAGSVTRNFGHSHRRIASGGTEPYSRSGNAFCDLY